MEYTRLILKRRGVTSDRISSFFGLGVCKPYVSGGPVHVVSSFDRPPCSVASFNVIRLALSFQHIQFPRLDGLLRTAHACIVIQYPPHKPHILRLESTSRPACLQARLPFSKISRRYASADALKSLDGLLGESHLDQFTAQLSDQPCEGGEWEDVFKGSLQFSDLLERCEALRLLTGLLGFNSSLRFPLKLLSRAFGCHCCRKLWSR